MKKNCLKKFESQGGASIMLAMILLLVCTTVGAAILTSVSASTGRLANQAKTDARYYSVRSAADLLINKIDGQSYVLERSRNVSTATVYEYDAAENDYVASGSAVSYTAYDMNLNINSDSSKSASTLDNIRSDSVSNSILTNTFLDFAYGKDVTPSAGLFDVDFPAISSAQNYDFDFVHDLGGSNNNLNVSITRILNPDGSLVFEINSNKGALDNYVLTVTFNAEISDNKDNPGITATTDYYYGQDGATMTEINAVKTTRTSTVTWTYAGMK